MKLPGIEQEVHALAGGQLPALVLLLDAIRAAPEEGASIDVVEALTGRLVRRLRGRGLGRRGHGYRPITRNCAGVGGREAGGSA